MCGVLLPTDTPIGTSVHTDSLRVTRSNVLINVCTNSGLSSVHHPCTEESFATLGAMIPSTHSEYSEYALRMLRVRTLSALNTHSEYSEHSEYSKHAPRVLRLRTSSAPSTHSEYSEYSESSEYSECARRVFQVNARSAPVRTPSTPSTPNTPSTHSEGPECSEQVP